MDTPTLIALFALASSFYAVFLQRKELAAQRTELKLAREAHERSSKALDTQAELDALSALLTTEQHLHNWNNSQVKDASLAYCTQESKKDHAKDNFKEIIKLKEEIKKVLDARKRQPKM